MGLLDFLSSWSCPSFSSPHGVEMQLTKEAVPLSQLRPGQRATILRVGGVGAVRRRYMEMGFIRGEKITVERVAPLGDPVEYCLKGYHLSLRKADAEQIWVQIVNG
jgi:ferrous iron transport protein A